MTGQPRLRLGVNIVGSSATFSQDIAFATTVILLTIMPARMSQDASQMGLSVRLVLLKSSALTFDLIFALPSVSPNIVLRKNSHVSFSSGVWIPLIDGFINYHLFSRP